MATSPSASAAADLRAPEVIVAGHVSLDLFPALYGPVRLEPGGLVVVGPARISTGGAVANVGVALHRLGVTVRLSAKIGADLFGTAVLDSLATHDRRLAEDIIVSEGEATSYTIVINPPGVDRSFLHCPGANRTYCASDVPYAKLAGVRVFHFGYPPLMPVMYADRGAQLRAMFARVQGAGVVTALDLCEPDPDSEAGKVDWTDVLAQTLPYVDVFAPSIDELLFMFDRPAHERRQAGAPLASVVDHARIAQLGDALTAMGAAVVAIKLGDQGLYLRSKRAAARLNGFCDRMGLAAEAWRDCEVLSPCFEPRTIGGTTGSGDSTIAGLLAALLRGAGPVEAATSATAVGAFSVEAVDPTSGVPTFARVAQRVREGWPRLPVQIVLAGDVRAERDAAGTMVLRR
ncbi:MAG: carbohydrate kinase family protein [Solirubrobacteraceae bacterium]